MEPNDARLEQIRQAEAYSHTTAYNRLKLFQPGSWLSKPVKSVMDQLTHFQSHESFRGLDLGCGVGRNCIPVLVAIPGIAKQMDCVDILPLAIDKLLENAAAHQVSDEINGIVCPVDRYEIRENYYDLILAVSVLEHLDSIDSLRRKLKQIRGGLRVGGIACMVINTSISELDQATGGTAVPQFEINIPALQMERILKETFSGLEILKNSVVHYQYDTWRELGTVQLDTDVLTFVVRKRK